MKNNNEKTFWSTQDESDEDFETIINSSQKGSELVESHTKSRILSSEKMDFLWSDEEEESFVKTEDPFLKEEELHVDREPYVDIGESFLKEEESLKSEEESLKSVEESLKLEEEPSNIKESFKEEDPHVEEINPKMADEYTPTLFFKEEDHTNSIKDEEIIIKQSSSIKEQDGFNIEDHLDDHNNLFEDLNSEDENYEDLFYKPQDNEIINLDKPEQNKLVDDQSGPLNENKEENHNDTELFYKDEVPSSDQSPSIFINDKKEDTVNKDPEIKEDELVEELQNFYDNNIQEAEILNEGLEVNSEFSPSLFDTKDSEDSDFLEQNTLIKELEEGIQNIKIEPNHEEDVNHKKPVEHVFTEINEPYQNYNEINHEEDVNHKKPEEHVFTEINEPSQNISELIQDQPEIKITENDGFLNEDSEEEDSEFFKAINKGLERDEEIETASDIEQNLDNECEEKHEDENSVIYEDLKENHEDDIKHDDCRDHEENNDAKLEHEENNDANLEHEDVNLIHEDVISDSTPNKEEFLNDPQFPSQMKIKKSNTSSPKRIIESSSVNLFSPRPLVCFLKGNLLTNHSSLQKRYTKQGTYKEHPVNIMNFYNLEGPYLVSDLDMSTCYENTSLNLIMKILTLKDIHAESISELINAKSVKYTTKSFNDTESISDINTAFNIANVNSKMAVDFAISQKMWTTALLISKMDQNIVNRVMSEILDEDMKGLFLDTKFEMKRPWKDYFMHFANTKKTPSHDKYLKEIFKEDFNTGFLVLVSLHLCKILDLSDYVQFFTHRNHLLNILMYINKNLIKINNIDLLYYEYICDLTDRNMKYAKEFYKNNKKEFRKELQDKMYELFELNWNFGIKDVLNFGISKILDVPENSKMSSQDKITLKNPIKSISKQNQLNIKVDNINTIDKHKIDNKVDINKIDNKVDINKIDNKVNETVIEESYNKKSKEVYADQKHSKSFADFFDSDKQEKEITTEDDTSLFLSNYNFEEDDEKPGIKKDTTSPEAEDKGSFFGIFNMFKKKSYKIDVKASDDIKYDPVTKRWVSGGQMETKKESPVIKKIPTPQMKSEENITMKEPSALKSEEKILKSKVDFKKMSLYAGKKKSNVGGFSTLKKPTQ